MTLLKAERKDAAEISAMSCRMMHETYDGLLPGGAEETEYCCGRFATREAYETMFDDHYVFWYIRDGDETVGFCAARVEGTMFQINKM